MHSWTKHFLLFIWVVLFLSWSQTFSKTFKDQQLRYPRVQKAFENHLADLQKMFQGKGFSYPPHRIFLRAFKQERQLELWAAKNKVDPFQKIKTYSICATSGKLGPKRKQGDGQIPEGIYYISHFNPTSRFHLSLKVSYPNKSDRILGASGRLGGDIFVHGNCVTIGCLPIEDTPMEELYALAVDVKTRGQFKIPIHIFPTQMTESNLKKIMNRWFTNDSTKQFWKNLKKGYDLFEQNNQVPDFRVDSKGNYIFEK